MKIYRLKSIISQIAVLFLLFITAVQASAFDSDTGTGHTLSPYFYIENGDPEIDRFPLESTDVNAVVNGVIADVTVTQTYKNNGPNPINARYIFPASTRAAVHGMIMTVGEKVIKAVVKERQEAQKTFDKAKAEGKSASLLKQQRPNVFSMNVANIMPDDRIKIELHYTELIVPDDKTYEFVYPTVVGPRYSSQPEAGAPETDQWVKNPYLPEGTKDKTAFTMTVRLAAGIPLQEAVCTSHQTEITWADESTADISLAASEKNGGNRDFILRYRLAGKKIQSGLLLYEGKDENFFLLMAEPPERVKPEMIPGREYIFVVDVSGSMNGFPLNTAKTLLKDLIGNLNPTDLFNVILFAGGSKVMAPASLPAAPESIRQAVQFIDRERGGGGTELGAALRKGLAMPMNEAYSRSMIVVTDGYISAEKEVFKLIADNLNRTNLFAFGIGSSVNRFLIEGMAKVGLGEPFVVTRPQEAAVISEKFRNYIDSPVLTGISVRADGIKLYDVEPPAVPDLFADRPVVIFGKWHAEGEGSITVSGTGGQGEYSRVFRTVDIASRDRNSALPYLWARSRIGRLSDFNPQKRSTENRAEITALGLTYNLLTAHTSFVAVLDEVRNTGAPAKTVKQPLPLPKGVSNLAVGGVSNVPEPELSVMIILLLFLVIFWGIARKIRQVKKAH